MFGTWMRWANMQRAERDLAKVHRQEGKQWQNRIQDELRDARRDNKSAGKWRLSRILAGQQMGAKRRRLNVPAAEVPTVGAWEQHLKKQGPEGGCEGEQVRVGSTTEIPPERSGLMYVQGANRKGWDEAPRNKQLTLTEHETMINRVTEER